MKKQNPIAKDLRTPKYKPRVVKDKTKYDRKNDKRQSITDLPYLPYTDHINN